ncbi:mobile mystery protein A [Cellulomonas composti]|uniref:Transcriptional regulator n=1 Tax=Cellulomonas composti TaxID=266130 RepID=A0A511JE85_9CELL|nr:mobile mystery protein A [Cellulomonas composti]GEL96053.1 transcriptional regulator [Cellulomonas composti]
MSDSEMIRRAIDNRVAPLQRDPSPVARPAGGWVRAVRTALAMSTTDLARRLGVTPVAVRKLEASERAATVRLETLQRAADALGCDLVYAFVPRTSLTEFAEARARDVAAAQVRRVDNTMALEDQRVHSDDLELLRSERARVLLAGRDLWRDEP